MKIKVTRRTQCRLCDSPKLRLVVPLAPTPVAEKYVSREELGQSQETYPLDLHMCLDCGHVQLLDVVDPEFLYHDFTYRSAKTKPLVDHFDECAERTCARFRVAAGGLVVDVGSNDGSLLRCFQKRGQRVIGIDPAVEIAREATVAGIPTLPEFLTPALAEKVRQEHGPASVVCAFNVFAHADDLGGMLDSIRAMLAPGGVFVFEVSYLLDILDHVLLGTIFHEHLSYHSLRPLVRFLERHGLELVDVQRVKIQGGSLIGTAQLRDGPHRPSPAVAELLALETARGLDQPATLEAFAAKLRQFNARLGELMADYRRQGKTVWGFGAARSGTTLIAQMGLGKVISAIVDDSPEKQHKFSPGDHIPILPTATLYEQKPDYTFILAWIHTDRILQNHRAYVEQGGHFIICFPEVRILGAGAEGGA